MNHNLRAPLFFATCMAAALAGITRAEGDPSPGNTSEGSTTAVNPAVELQKLKLTMEPLGSSDTASATPVQSNSTPRSKINPSLTVALQDAVMLDDMKAANTLTLKFDLPIWLAGINGTAGIAGLSVPVNASFWDILQDTDSVIGLGGRFEADYGPWIFFADGLFMKLAIDNIAVARTSVNFTSELAIADIGLMYQFGNWKLSSKGAAGPELSAAGGVGGRYMHVGLKVNGARGLFNQQNEDWADPVAVGQVILDIDKHWQLLARGDVGGGTGADFTWSAVGMVAYRFKFNDKVSGAIKLGYEAIGEDFHNGSGFQEFTWDAIMHGPVIDFAVEF